MPDKKPKCPWITPPKQHGVRTTTYPNLPRNRVFNQALQEYSDIESKAWDKTITAETILFNLVVHPNAYKTGVARRIRARYLKLKKENQDEARAKSIDGIKYKAK